MQDRREVLIRKNLSSNDGGCAMCGSGLSSSGELFLVSLDVAGSLDQCLLGKNNLRIRVVKFS